MPHQSKNPADIYNLARIILDVREYRIAWERRAETAQSLSVVGLALVILTIFVDSSDLAMKTSIALSATTLIAWAYAWYCIRLVSKLTSREHQVQSQIKEWEDEQLQADDLQTRQDV
jgi:hypothetical protein